jgi:hypothetical protein
MLLASWQPSDTRHRSIKYESVRQIVKIVAAMIEANRATSWMDRKMPH